MGHMSHFHHDAYTTICLHNERLGSLHATKRTKLSRGFSKLDRCIAHAVARDYGRQSMNWGERRYIISLSRQTPCAQRTTGEGRQSLRRKYKQSLNSEFIDGD